MFVNQMVRLVGASAILLAVIAPANKVGVSKSGKTVFADAISQNFDKFGHKLSNMSAEELLEVKNRIAARGKHSLAKWKHIHETKHSIDKGSRTGPKSIPEPFKKAIVKKSGSMAKPLSKESMKRLSKISTNSHNKVDHQREGGDVTSKPRNSFRPDSLSMQKVSRDELVEYYNKIHPKNKAPEAAAKPSKSDLAEYYNRLHPKNKAAEVAAKSLKSDSAEYYNKLHPKNKAPEVAAKSSRSDLAEYYNKLHPKNIAPKSSTSDLAAYYNKIHPENKAVETEARQHDSPYPKSEAILASPASDKAVAVSSQPDRDHKSIESKMAVDIAKKFDGYGHKIISNFAKSHEAPQISVAKPILEKPIHRSHKISKEPNAQLEKVAKIAGKFDKYGHKIAKTKLRA